MQNAARLSKELCDSGQTESNGGDFAFRSEPAAAVVAHDSFGISQLNRCALLSLAKLFDSEKQLFRSCLPQPKRAQVGLGLSRRRTLIALLGLRRLAETGGSLPFELAPIEQALFDDPRWVRDIGDLGLFIWFAALYAPERLEELSKRCAVEDALTVFADARQSRTKHLAWFLTGVAQARSVQADGFPDLTDLAVNTYHKLQENQGEEGIFSNRGPIRFAGRSFGGRFGTFADQAHAIYALVRFAKAFEVEDPLESAMNCASAVCGLQGPLGQWWWLYDSVEGSVACRYPIVAMHQYGTAPMALFALAEATGLNFGEPIRRGLSWVYGRNELGVDLRSLTAGSIAHSIGTSLGAQYWETMLSFAGISKRQGQLRLRSEIRPDHLGWMLYGLGR